ncbi:helix-turn-helix domain-containing protein (plasmid) [Pseudonocardia sp. DSM 110487]|uniref:helix-turn-helix domain-containing protein n=1 Tax=Pseudonocardia sp. DSM 110487 TaxID=2865833 RepID=UPI001C6A0EBF|nr:helix-turn-helix domain-containing protein [Pseudonocardia sp. DSM 110487]QYN41185.1 helix-turn-helix domain-containing protein [Pseudonocardia sp. DSM 110487]
MPTTSEEGRRLVSTGEAARALQVDPTTLQRWANAKRVTPASKTLGGHLRWDLDDLRRQIADIVG